MKLFPVKSINADTKKNLYSLLKTMDKKTKTTVENKYFETIYTTGGILKENNNGVFGSNCIEKLPDYPIAGSTTVRLNDKEYTIDNKSGKISSKEFSTQGITQKTCKEISDLINKVKENFENSNIVEQWRWGVSGIISTPESRKKWNESLKKVYESLKVQKTVNK